MQGNAEIELDGYCVRSKVLINGQDITDCVKGIDIRARVGECPEISIICAMPQTIKLDGAEIKTVIDYSDYLYIIPFDEDEIRLKRRHPMAIGEGGSKV